MLGLLERIDDSMVTNVSTDSEEITVEVTKLNVCVCVCFYQEAGVDALTIWVETMVDVPKPEVEANEPIALKEAVESVPVTDTEQVLGVDVSSIWEETVVGPPKPKVVEADELIAWGKTVVPGTEGEAKLDVLGIWEKRVDDTEPNIGEANADVSKVWEEVVVNALEPDDSEKLPLGSEELRELTSVNAVASAVIGSPLPNTPELTFSAITVLAVLVLAMLASVEIDKAEAEVSEPTSRPF